VHQGVGVKGLRRPRISAREEVPGLKSSIIASKRLKHGAGRPPALNEVAKEHADMNIALLFEERFNRMGERVMAYFEGRPINNRLLRDRANRLGNALGGLGVGPEDIVAVTMSNCPEVLEAFGAVFRIGAVLLPILFVLTAAELRYMLQDSGAVAVVTDFTQEQKVLEATADLESVKLVIVVGAGDTSRVLDYENLLEKSSATLTTVPREPRDDALVMYTSGTTGNPKGVVLTHNNLLEAARSSLEVNELTKPRNAFLCLPLAHIYGVAAMNTGALSEVQGAVGVIMRWFEPEECMRLIEEYRIGVFPGVPAMFALLLHHPAADRYDLSSLEDCVSASAPLPREVREAFTSKFDCTMRELYGLTEASGMGAATRPSHPFREGAVGKAYPNLELSIFDDDDNALPPGQAGEVVMRGPHVMKGYLNMPEETAEVLRGGWLHTGDIGHLDDDGFLYITDRKKDLIIKGGENVMPAFIEKVIFQHPAVLDAAAIGVADEIYGEDIVAYVALKPGCSSSSVELLEFCGSRLPSFKRPREVIVVENLPKSSVGKTLKRELQRLYREKEA
jgi:long-chain acyl-CoA synthetase